MEAELSAIASGMCAHFDLSPVRVRISELGQELDGLYVPQLECAPAQIFVSSSHDPCRSLEDILSHELAHHLQHCREPGTTGDHYPLNRRGGK
jgi:hypothetical protein